jgi:hypothetical protein
MAFAPDGFFSFSIVATPCSIKTQASASLSHLIRLSIMFVTVVVGGSVILGALFLVL